jgi:LCP family protein required for cell wall assembly
MLSIPRDLYVDVPGFGRSKINTAYANGGLPLAIKTVRQFTSIDVNHVMQIDFDGFRSVVDALGGIDIVNPYYVASGPEGFDGRKPVFPKGKLHLNGRDALAYARMRKVSERSRMVNEEEGTELGRGRRQQRIIDAITSQVAGFDSVRKPRGVPRAVVQPLITDANAGQLIAFGFGKWWSKPKNNLRCRLGGDSESRDIDGTNQDVLVPVPENRATIRMWLGKQAPIKPANAEAPGCTRESATG